MQAQIDKALGNRFDATATNARFLAKQADDLHKSGKHAESMKKYDEAAEAAKLKLEKK